MQSVRNADRSIETRATCDVLLPSVPEVRRGRPGSGTLFEFSQQRLMNILGQEVGDIALMAGHFFHQ